MPETSRQRLESLKSAKDNWDGQGAKGPPHDGLDWFADWLEGQENDGLPLPFLFPTADGGVWMTWDTPSGAQTVGMEVNLTEKTVWSGDFDDIEVTFDLNNPQDVLAWREETLSRGILGRDTLAARALAAATPKGD